MLKTDKLEDFGENNVYKFNPPPKDNAKSSKDSTSWNNELTAMVTGAPSQSRQVALSHVTADILEDYSLVPAWAIALIVLLLVVVVVAVIMIMY